MDIKRETYRGYRLTENRVAVNIHDWEGYWLTSIDGGSISDAQIVIDSWLTEETTYRGYRIYETPDAKVLIFDADGIFLTITLTKHLAEAKAIIDSWLYAR